MWIPTIQTSIDTVNQSHLTKKLELLAQLIAKHLPASEHTVRGNLKQ